MGEPGLFISSPMSKRITHSELLKTLRYDPETGNFYWLVVRRKRNGFTSIGELAGWTNCKGYRKVGINGELYSQHQLAIFYMTGKWPKQQVDHRNGDTEDNRYLNLRSATAVQNGRNRKVGRNSTSGVVGVFQLKTTGLWRAHIKLKNKRVYLGDFVLKEEAVAARSKAESAHFGEFRRSAA